MRQGAFLNIYLLNNNSWSHQTWPINRHKQRQYFSVVFWTIWRTGARFQVFFHLQTCPNYSITNYVKIPVLDSFEKVNKGQLKICKCQPLKMARSCYIIKLIYLLYFNKIKREPGTSFQSPAFSQKHIRNVCHTAH